MTGSRTSTEPLTWKKGLCGLCPAGCWIEAGLHQGILKDIRPDPDSPLGMLCHRGRHAPEIVYSPDRLTQPLKRSGSKGNLDFKPVSWDEAYDLMAENLVRIKTESGPEALSIYTGRGAFELSLCDIFQPKGVAVSSASSVLFPFGSPNTMGVGALCYVSFAMIAPHVTMGRMLINMFTDIENADLLLVWGTNPATDSPPLDMTRLERAARRGAKIVGIDPRHTEALKRTGAQWIPIRPGTDGALALSLLSVIIEEDLYDEEFAAEWCHGFGELCAYVQHFTPDVVAETTGVPAEIIRDLARQIGRTAAACPVMYTGLEYADSGVQTIRAILTLFALTGHLDRPGGIGLAMPDSHFPINRSCNQPNPNPDMAVARDLFPLYTRYREEAHASGLLRSVLEGEPYPLRGLIIHGASLQTSWPQPEKWRGALAKLDFLVTIDRQFTADSRYADLILPATTLFEITSYMVYGPLFRIREKIIEPVGQARNDYLIMAGLAQRLGYGQLYPQTEEALLRFVLRGSGFTPKQVRARGGAVSIRASMMEYRKWEKGLLRSDGKPGFDTPTGKFEIRSTILEDNGYEPLPRYIEPKEGPRANPQLSREFPLVFNSGARLHTGFRSQFHNIPGLLRDHPEPVVEMHPRDARPRHIQTGDLVEVASPRGAVPFRALVTEDIVPGAVECNMGGGTPLGPEAWQNRNVNILTDRNHFDEISGFPVYKALLCEVRKINDGRRIRIPRQMSTERVVEKIEPVKPDFVYCDNNATTVTAVEVRNAMLPFLTEEFGNPSSIHRSGIQSRQAIQNARRQLARLIHCKPGELIFTSGGSEANNLAIKGIAFSPNRRGRHLITTAIEHPSVLNTCRFLEMQEFRVTYLPVDEDGRINPADLETAITDDTFLISIMLANNETGSLQPVSECVKIARQQGILLHTDAIQAVGKIPVDFQALGVDLLSISGHKFHGPKGVGALAVRKGLLLAPLIHGGKQEKNLRGGTENLPGIVGLGAAADLAQQHLTEMEQVARLRDTLQQKLLTLFPDARVNGTRRLPNTLNITIPGFRGESLVLALDQRGIALSSGSACKSGSPEPTHVLIAMARTPEEAHCSIRFSLSRFTGEKDIHVVVKAIKQVLRDLESTVRFLPCK